MSAVSVKNLWYTYPLAKEPTLRGVNLEVNKGEFVVILGPSGCGKSTLAIALNGVIPHEMGGSFEGTVVSCGMDTRRWKARDLARKVGIVFQNPEAQIIHTRVEDEVVFPMQNLLMDPEYMKRRLDEVLSTVGLVEFKKSLINTLSGGQKQRLAIATSLAMNPEVLILDEPTVHLDPRGIKEVLSTVEKLNKEHSITMILIEHKLDEIIRLADKIAVMNDGCIVDVGPPRELLRRQAGYIMEKLGLFIPQVSEIAYLVSKKGHHFDSFPMIVDEFPKNLRVRPLTKERQTRSDADAILEVNDVSFSYPSGHTAVKQVTLSFKAGRVYAVVGSNGSGKTTLAKLLVGLLKPSIGKIEFKVNGETIDVSKTSPRTLCKYIGFAFQNPEHQFVTDRVFDEVAFGLQVSGHFSEKEIEERTNKMLDMFGLRSCSSEHPLSLSMGQKRRLSIATMLVLEPRLIIFDEPMTGQDKRRTDYIIDLINELKGKGSTSLFITHDMHFVADVATDVVVLEKGKLLFSGTPEELFNSSDVMEAASLTDPMVHKLAMSLNSGLRSVIRVKDLCDSLVVAR